MNNKTTSSGRLVMAIVALLTGLILLFLVPKLSISVMDNVLKAVEDKYIQTGNSTFESAQKVFTFFFPFWTGLTIAAGGLLLLFAIPLYRGDKWSRPLAMVLLAVPAITGAYMFGPIIFFAKNLIGTAGIIAMLGLIPYFIILLWDKSTIKEKLICFLLFLFIGIESAYSFTNGHSSLRMFLGWPEGMARTTEYYFYAFGIPVIWAGVVLGILAIPLYAARRNSGWWLATGGSLLMLIGTIIFYLAKPNGWFTTGIVLTLISLILLVTPAIGGSVANQNKNEEKIIQVLSESK